MTDDWDVSFHCDKRVTANHASTQPVAPTYIPPAIALKRDTQQRFILTAAHGDSTVGMSIVAVCQELRTHTPEERYHFLTNIAHLCDIKLGELQ